jgi:translocator protein
MLKLIISLLLPFLAGAVGSLATFSAIPTWYAGLIKPAWNPPNFLFGPVWTILYIMMGISYYLVITQKFTKKVLAATRIYYFQLIFNTLWSVVFFGYKNPFLGLFVITVLWASIALTIIDFYRVKKVAAYLLVPYILWVSFASFLNLTIFLLNR